MRLSIYAMALMFATTSVARADEPDNWTTTADAVHAQAAGISLPQQAGLLNLTKTGEISDEGATPNSYAQYASTDNVVQATIFLYRPGFADTAIAALGTERALIDRFGPSTRKASQIVTAAGGRKNVALRTIYSGAADGQLVLAAAFVRSGEWILKLRVTATADRAADVEAGVDALLQGLAFDKPAEVQAARTVAVADCAVDTAPALPVADAAFPRNGADALCRRAIVKVGEASFDMLQPAQGGNLVLVPTDDAGGLLRFDRLADGSYMMTRYGTGAAAQPKRYDALPNAEQMAAIIGGSDAASSRTATALR